MALTTYNPNNTFPDLDGSGGNGPLQLPQDQDVFTYDAHYVSASAKNGVFGKIIDGLYYLWKRYAGPFELHYLSLFAGQAAGSSTIDAHGGTAGYGPVVNFTNHTSSPGYTVILGFPPLPPGAVVSTVGISSAGTANTGGGYVAALYQVISVDTNGVIANLSAAVSDSQNSAGWTSGTPAQTNIPLTGGGFTVSKTLRYFLQVQAPYSTTTNTGYLMDMKLTGTY